MKAIFAFGDSITYGCWDRENQGRSSLLRKDLDDKNPFPQLYFYVLGIPGETTTGLINRFESEVNVRKRYDDEEYAFIFAFGANDATWLTKETRFKNDIDAYEKNMKEVISKAKELTKKIILLNITPVNDEITKEFKGKDKTCNNKFVDDYNKRLKEISVSEGVILVDVNSNFKNEGHEKLLMEDGLHPNTEGHRIIYELVKKELNRVLG